MNGLRDDSLVLDVLENDQAWIYGLDNRLEDRQAWVAKLKKRLVMADTISYVGGTATAANRNDDNNLNISKPSIFRIPACIREVDPATYEPYVISLGPYHHGKPKLRAMDELKWGYFRRFLRRNPEKDLDDYLAQVEALESQARGAYEELEPPIDSKDFVQMMMLDCCFLLEILLIYRTDWEQGGGGEEEEEEEEGEDIHPINKSPWAMPIVLRDILLLENQLPFFLLERLLELNIPHQTPSFPQIVLRVFWEVMPGKIQMMPTNTNGAVVFPIHHILHLMYSRAILPKDQSKSSSPASLRRQVQNCGQGGGIASCVTPNEPTLNWIPRAKKLSEAGVVFKRKKDYASFLEVTFDKDKGVMEIPPLQIFGYVDSVFRNLIAFEQCHASNRSSLYISTYAYLMNLVVDTAADVQLLKQERIIVSTLGNDKDIAILFNQLCKNTSLNKNCNLDSVFDDIRIHCDKRRNRWKATLNHNYFSNPWAIISLVAAIFLFTLAITQTVLAFLRHYRQS